MTKPSLIFHSWVVLLVIFSPNFVCAHDRVVSMKRTPNILANERQRTRRSTDLREDEILAALDKHNELRGGVFPPAANMKYMVWDDSLASMAQQWSEECVWSHGQPDNISPFGDLGQNLWAGSYNPPIADAIQLWYDEVELYTYNTRACSGVCGHYTQIVWADSYALGCGRFYCGRTSDRSKIQNQWIITCNYGPPGNYGGQYPYIEGRSCSKCKNGVGECYNNQCRSCSEHNEPCECRLECQNCGILLPGCTCECRDGWNEADCSSRCEDTGDLCWANPGWPGPYMCPRDPSIPEKCPLMCGRCNEADPTFICDPQMQIEHSVTLTLIGDINEWSQIKLDFRRILANMVTRSCNKSPLYQECCSTTSTKRNPSRLSFVQSRHVAVPPGYPREISANSISVLVYVRYPESPDLCVIGGNLSGRRKRNAGNDEFLSPDILEKVVNQNCHEIGEKLGMTMDGCVETGPSTEPSDVPPLGPQAPPGVLPPGDGDSDSDDSSSPGDQSSSIPPSDEGDSGSDETSNSSNDDDKTHNEAGRGGVPAGRIILILVLIIVIAALVVLGLVMYRRNKSGESLTASNDTDNAEL